MGLHNERSPLPLAPTTKPRRAVKPTKIRDVKFIAPARTRAAFLATCGDQGSVLYCTHMNTTTFSVRVGRSTKSRLEKLAKSTVTTIAFDDSSLQWFEIGT
jgi:hypothetical protein